MDNVKIVNWSGLELFTESTSSAASWCIVEIWLLHLSSIYLKYACTRHVSVWLAIFSCTTRFCTVGNCYWRGFFRFALFLRFLAVEFIRVMAVFLLLDRVMKYFCSRASWRRLWRETNVLHSYEQVNVSIFPKLDYPEIARLWHESFFYKCRYIYFARIYGIKCMFLAAWRYADVFN
jgi:hypothetical protein